MAEEVALLVGGERAEVTLPHSTARPGDVLQQRQLKLSTKVSQQFKDFYFGNNCPHLKVVFMLAIFVHFERFPCFSHKSTNFTTDGGVLNMFCFYMISHVSLH